MRICSPTQIGPQTSIIHSSIDRLRALDGTTNWLIAFLSGAEILHQSAHVIYLYVVVSGVDFVLFLPCTKLLMHTVFGINLAVMLMSAVALDRVICVLSPFR